MANPAPTINQINAFNATQGTTIDFNIIGGTELVRSNRIYIYDLSDNSLICTHLYVSTESIHELPPNTDGSIVYESGKSSADFVNGAQYYAQIQTFTDIAGTEGGSGLSVAKMFWCLVDPTLTIDTIPSTISTTSYNVSATYTPNTSGGATNEIQEFQFNLYSAIGALLQTSGVVLYGEGVDLSYNFSGLEVNSTYYVTLDVTTTQGMNVSVQSDTFTVSIDTPTMGSASVVNNGCDGYISVTSNLSSEYEHEESAEAGEIMSFTTDSVNDITELDVDFSPVQDGTPWMSAQDTEPYMFRPVPSQTEDFGYESDTIIGGTVAWNQLFGGDKTALTYGITADYSSGVLNLSGTPTTATGAFRVYVGNYANMPSGHKFLFTGASEHFGIRPQGYSYATTASKPAIVFISGDALISDIVVNFVNLDTTATYSEKITPQLFDLTAMFGSTIADYIYSLEQANAGAGVAWFRKLFPKPYYAYNAGELMSVQAASHDTVGFNAWDEEWELGALSSTGGNATSSTEIRSKNYIPVVGGQTYYLYCAVASTFNYKFYDADKNFISGAYIGRNNTLLIPNDARYMRFYMGAAYGTTYNNDICINLSWDGERDGEYEEYVKHSYPLDSSLTLRGIPKLDASNNLYYDGDTYESDGTVTRKYRRIVGSDFVLHNTSSAGYKTYKYVTANTGYMANVGENITSNITNNVVQSFNSATVSEECIQRVAASDNAKTIYIVLAPSRDVADLALIYELATPTTETADPYTNPQIVDPSGTEEYVGSPIPVGHKTTYQRICPITGWTGCEVDVAGANLLNLVESEMISSGWNRSFPFTIKPGTYILSCVNVFGGSPKGAKVSLVDENNTSVKTISSGYNFGDSSLVGVETTITESEAKSIKKILFEFRSSGVTFSAISQGKIQLEVGSTPTTYHAYNGTTYNITWQTEAGTVYGGYVDLVTGVLTVEYASINPTSVYNVYYHSASGLYYVLVKNNLDAKTDNTGFLASNMFVNANGVVIGNCYITATGTYLIAVLADQTITTKAQANTWFSNNNVQFVYELQTPQTYQLTPHQIQTLVGQNNLWHDTNGEMTIMYQLQITDLLVKRKDVSQVGSQWLTLHSVPITQASDMDFTFIDFLNQYGKTYQYALVPVLAQDQSGVIVQIEGGYTTSDTIDSVFDGVYIADQTNVERVKAGVGYGNIDMNQGVGSITPIGSKYPIVITNSQNQYHNGSIRGTIVPNDFYSNGNLSRIDMVNKRDELEQFLTNKRAKIIKDWNGKMWLVMIMSNVNCSFDDNYGMGMVSFSADWLEVGDPTNQEDLQATGLINVGGV